MMREVKETEYYIEDADILCECDTADLTDREWIDHMTLHLVKLKTEVDSIQTNALLATDSLY